MAGPVNHSVLLRTLEKADHPLGVAELLRSAGLHGGQRTELKRAMRALVKEGRVEREGARFALPGRAQRKEKDGRPGRGRKVLEGTLTVHRDGFGFVDVGEEEDVFVPPHEARRALDGDRVKVEVVAARGGRSEGRIVGVVGRQREALVGTYVERGGHDALVRPHDPSLPGPVRVPRTQLARDGDVVTVRLGVGADLLPPGGLVGEVTGSLGRPGDPSQDVLAIVFSQGFSEAFPPEVMDEADRIPLHVAATDVHPGNRRDVRALSLVTIDGVDARDFDDAVYAEELPGGATRLWVAIADVSHYVRPGSALDAEAHRRGTSVYLPNRVLPMLPERLSNGICSLRPEEDRLCLVAEMTFDRDGQRTATELYPGLMRSAARCTYEEVQRVLDGEAVPDRERFRPLFERLQRIGRKLRKLRETRGAIDFDLPETRPELDGEGRPVRMVRRERKESHRIVEDCMLAANEAVAAYFQERQLPSVYRFHGEPDPDKLAAFGELARAHGFAVPGKGEPTSRELNLFMRGLIGHPGQRALNQLLLRSMMQAVYSPDQVGHYGLGAEEYLHFTSPIRRYPDLLVHRLLRAHWERGTRRRPERELEHEVDELRRMAEHSSERERAAMKVEREVNALYACLLMEERVGEEFAATVSSLADFGFFVELDSEHVEGLVRADDLGPGHRLVVGALVWPSGRRVQVGQALTVRLAGVNVGRRQMDFEVVAFAGERPARRRGGAERIDAPAPERTGAAAPGDGRGHRGRAGGPGRPAAGDGRDRRGPADGHRGHGPADERGRRGPAEGRGHRGGQERRGRSGGPRGSPDAAQAGREQPLRSDRGAHPPSGKPSRPERGGSGRSRQPAPSRHEDASHSAPSPHPGFDRLRALAERRPGSGGRPTRPGRSGDPSRGGGSGRQGRSRRRR